MLFSRIVANHAWHFRAAAANIKISPPHSRPFSSFSELMKRMMVQVLSPDQTKSKYHERCGIIESVSPTSYRIKFSPSYSPVVIPEDISHRSLRPLKSETKGDVPCPALEGTTKIQK